MGKVSLLTDQFFFFLEAVKSVREIVKLCACFVQIKRLFYLGENIVAVGIGHMAIHDAIKWCKRSWKIKEIIVLR